jgi:hypothetical protein
MSTRAATLAHINRTKREIISRAIIAHAVAFNGELTARDLYRKGWRAQMKRLVRADIFCWVKRKDDLRRSYVLTTLGHEYNGQRHNLPEAALSSRAVE